MTNQYLGRVIDGKTNIANHIAQNSNMDILRTKHEFERCISMSNYRVHRVLSLVDTCN